jgi:hypothetical protein
VRAGLANCDGAHQHQRPGQLAAWGAAHRGGAPARRRRTPAAAAAAARGGRPASTRLSACALRARTRTASARGTGSTPAAASAAAARRSPLGGLPARQLQASAASAPRPAAPHPRSTPLLADLPHRLASPSSARVSLARPSSVCRSPRRLAPRSVSSSSARPAQGTHRSTCAQRPHTELAARPRSESAAALSAPLDSIAFACARSSLGALTRTASAGGVPDVLAPRARRVQPQTRPPLEPASGPRCPWWCTARQQHRSAAAARPRRRAWRLSQLRVTLHLSAPLPHLSL